jgi:formamidopyrimidine-DNA glycosylase
MPELPEVETLKRGLQKNVIGKMIAKVEVRLPKIVAFGPETVSNVRKLSKENLKSFEKILTGQKIINIERRAKILIFKLSGPWSVLIHLKLTGQLIFAKKGEKKEIKIYNALDAPRAVLPHKYTHIIFEFTDKSRLFFNDLRQFGYLKLVRDKDLAEVKELKEFGPEPLAAEFKFADFLAKAKHRPGLKVKQFLVDPKVVAGIGNIYSDEILFWAKIRPNRALRSLALSDWKAIYQNIPRVLEKAIKAHGSSVGDFLKLDGSEGNFGQEHMVYQRYDEPCKKCGSKIEKLKIGGRTSCYCPKCQK